METIMHRTLLAGAAAIALASLPASAQDASANSAVTMTSTQQATYDGWPSDRRSAYDLWPEEHRTYFWTLPPEHQEAYWLLNAEQRAQIQAMTPAQREEAWTSIAAQIAAGANNSETSGAARTGGQVPAAAQSAEGANASAAPPPAAEKDYPVCTARIQDSCQNPGEGGAPGRSRALDHWPGEPASERD